AISNKSIEVFVPKIQMMSRRTDRKKKILIPLLPGYVFVHFEMNPEIYWTIIRTVGVVRMIGFEGKPVAANEAEINSLMILDGTDRTVQNRDYIKKGDRVMIMDGPLKGLVGFYMRHKGQADKVVVSIELLQRSVEVELEDWVLEKL
ncbi:MAG: transcriptional antiterminator, partial [Desulfobacteraceae bacterium]